MSTESEHIKDPWSTVDLAIQHPIPTFAGFAIKQLARALLELRTRIEKLEPREHEPGDAPDRGPDGLRMGGKVG